MKLAKQVCSIDLGIRLEDLGFKRESIFVWVDVLIGRGVWQRSVLLVVILEDVEHFKILAPAFTVAELGEMLPPHFHSQRLVNKFSVSKGGSAAKPHAPVIHADTEADARAKMLIHLIEKGIVKP